MDMILCANKIGYDCLYSYFVVVFFLVSLLFHYTISLHIDDSFSRLFFISFFVVVFFVSLLFHYISSHVDDLFSRLFFILYRVAFFSSNAVLRLCMHSSIILR